MSPRPKKPRRCCPVRRPNDLIYKPAGTPMSGLEKVKLAADELEAARLCDVECLTQTEAGEIMGVSRGTIQRLVASGRKKIVEAILNGRVLMIE
ncbi:MAG: DUF134 domain-containing protein [Desulfuromonadales bacterium]|nr:DUF134 domain-containing protein [Desulfuromonadales bacterium]